MSQRLLSIVLLSSCGLLGGEQGASSSAPSARATQVAVSGTSCAQTEGGTVRCWGSNTNGELGADTSKTTFDRVNVPIEVKGLSGVTAIASGSAFNCALLSSKTVKCWGFNASGQLGNGKDLVDSTASASSMTPTDVAGLSDVKSIALGDTHACALTSAGAVKCWGDGESGQLGDGLDLVGSTSGHLSNKPVDVKNLSSGVRWLSARGDLSCVVTSARAIQCWGRQTSVPTAIAGFDSGFEQVHVGGGRGYGPQMVCGITMSGEAKCMGTYAKDSPMLGRGTNSMADAVTPVTVSGLTSGVTSMGLGSSVACAIQNGGLKCWGENDGDQVLGVGEMPTFSSVPVALPMLENVTSVSIGSCNACAVAGGAAFCWGRKSCVGNGNEEYSTVETYRTPQAVKSLP